MIKKTFFSVTVFLLFWAAISPIPLSSANFQLPPLWSSERFMTNGLQIEQIRFLGPIGNDTRALDGEGSIFAVRPLWSEFHDPEKGYSGYDILWPASMIRRSPQFELNTFLFLINCRKGETDNMYYLLPFWCYTRTPHHTWWMLFPLYGNQCYVWGEERIRFLLFPLYLQKQSKTADAHSILWPLVYFEHSKNASKWRILPFYAQKEVYGVSFNQSVLWPFFSRMKSLDRQQSAYGWMAWPFFGYNQMGEHKEYTTMWPLFVFSANPSGSRQNIRFLWPLFQKKKDLSQQESTLSVWPFFGVSESKHASSFFAVWPLLSSSKFQNSARKESRFLVFPFVHLYQQDQMNEQNNSLTLKKNSLFWPFLSFRETPDLFKVQFPALLPLERIPVVERNLLPFFRFTAYEKNEDRKVIDVLWGMFHYSKSKTLGTRLTAGPFYTLERPAVNNNASSCKQSRYAKKDLFLSGLISTQQNFDGKRTWKVFWLLEF